MNENVYLGCSQVEIVPDPVIISGKRETFNRLCFTGPSGKPLAGREAELSDPSPETLTKNKNKNKSNTPNAVLKENPSDKARAFATSSEPKVFAYMYEMKGHIEKTVDRYCELSGQNINQLVKVPTPSIDDHLIPVEEFEIKGVLAPVAARIVLMALFFARLARMDVMWTVNLLAREVTRWSPACDRCLHRLICFLHHTKDHGVVCFVGDRASDFFLMLFPTLVLRGT